MTRRLVDTGPRGWLDIGSYARHGPGQRDRLSNAQVAPGEIGEVGRRRHPAGPRPLPEQAPVFGLEAHVQARIAVHFVGLPYRGWVIETGGPQHDIEQLPKQCRFRDPVAFSESSDAGFRLRRHATGDEGELSHA